MEVHFDGGSFEVAVIAEQVKALRKAIAAAQQALNQAEAHLQQAEAIASASTPEVQAIFSYEHAAEPKEQPETC